MVIKKGEQLLASDMLNLVFFPKGTILMYDGTSWTNNVTLQGWYKCDGNNGAAVNGLTIPDLRNKFIMGYDSGSRTGGSNDRTLGIANIPGHSHTFKNENISTGDAVPTKAGVTDLTGHFVGDRPNIGAMSQASGIVSSTDETNKPGISGTDVDNARHYIDARHTHTVNLNGKSTNNTGDGTAFDNRPSYYALIYIIKVTEAGS